MKKTTWLIVGILLAGILLFPFEVPSVNEHEGAVALTQPTLTSTSPNACFASSSGIIYSAGCGGSVAAFDVYTGEVTAVDVNLTALAEKYESPKPVRRSVIQSLFFGTATTLTPISGGGFGGGGFTQDPSIGGSGCTPKEGTGTKTFETYAVMEITQPNGEKISWTSEHKSWTVNYAVFTYSVLTGCTSAGAPTTGIGGSWKIWSPNAQTTVDYVPGTVYFTAGCGGYDFSVKVYRVVPDTPDSLLGSTSATVMVEPEGACGG